MKEDMNTSRTAGVIIIGNEILSGKVRDTNSSFLASGLRGLGVSLRRITVIPDEVEVIAQEVSAFSKEYDYVFTAGGIGPTHDDVTMEGIAKGFGVKLVKHPDLVTYFKARYRDRANEAMLKMAELPEGGEIIDAVDGSLPIVCFRNVFIFPGIPRYLEEKFSAIRERFRCPACYLRRIFLKAYESDIAEILNQVVARNGEVAFGSYPILDNPDYTIIITAESRSMDALNEAVDQLIGRLPREILVRVE